MAAGPLRRRGGGEDAAPAPGWAGLHVDLLELVAARVLATGGFLDYIRFRAVCPQWRAAAASPRGRGVVDPRFHPRRWMLFPEGFGRFPGHRADGGHARFFDLAAAGAFVRVPIPELKNHCVLDSSDGLLLLQRDGDGAVRLLHPFTGDVAEFPSLDTLVRQLCDLEDSVQSHYNFGGGWLYSHSRCLDQVRKVCAAINVTATGVVTVMLALDQIGRVVFASVGDCEWTISSWEVTQLDRALSYQGKLYVVNWDDGVTRIVLIDPPLPQCHGEGSSSELPLPLGEEEGSSSGSPLSWHEEEGSSSQPTLPPPRTVATCSSHDIYLPSLVELDSEIMLVGYNDRSFSCILVLKLADLVLGRTVPVASIGDHVLFAGARSLCVSSNWLPSIGANSIICFHAGENYLAQYHLSTGTWSPASDGHLMLGPPPRPCSLIHHIFTCCDRRFWNKGMMFCINKEHEWWVMRISRFGASLAFD